jgi:hypothetical protein
MDFSCIYLRGAVLIDFQPHGTAWHGIYGIENAWLGVGRSRELWYYISAAPFSDTYHPEHGGILCGIYF